jgi:restriction endonuclease S subunit
MTELPSHWQLVRFGELVGSKDSLRIPIKESDRAARRGQIPYYGASGIIDYIDTHIFEGEHLLVAEDGANLLSRSSPIAFMASDRFWVNNHAHVLVPNGKATLQYLLQFLSQLDLEPYVTGTAQPKLTYASLARILVLLPPLAEQQQIAAILDQAEALRAKRRYALAQLDAITQSLFLDLFGDPAANPKHWPTAQLGDVIHSATDGPHVSPAYADQGVPFVSARHIRRGGILWTDLKFLSAEDALVHWRKCKPERGDILYTKGGTTGIAKVVDFDQQIALWVHVALLKTNSNKVDPLWLENMLNSDFCYLQSQRLTHGIANRDLGLKRMVRIQLYLPPLPLQREFAAQVSAVERLKAAQRASLAKLDALFASLQHRAFRGEL